MASRAESENDSGHMPGATTLQQQVTSAKLHHHDEIESDDFNDNTVDKPFKVSPAGNPIQKSLLWAARPAFEHALKFQTLNEIYAQTQAIGNDRHFADRALEALGIIIDVDENQLARIPQTGPVVIVANHPFGGLEGLILTTLLHRVRADVKLLANYMLRLIPDLRKDFFFTP